MHGIVVTNLKAFVTEECDENTWNELAEAGGLGGQIILPTKTYPDGDVVDVIEAASEATGTPVRDLQRAFGRFLAPKLFDLYRARIDDDWTALDMLERTEDQIHTIVRINNPDSKPPEIDATRRSDDELVITYSSDRRLCDVAKGIIDGVAEEYGTRLSVDESTCMHDRAASCELYVRR